MTELPRRFALLARTLLPVEGPPLRRPVVTVRDGLIESVGAAAAGCPLFDLGDVLLLPGLVNAHVHLEYSLLSAPLGTPGMAFPDWIRLVVEWKRSPLHQPQAALAAGLQQSLAAGVTALGEIASPGWSAAPFEQPGQPAADVLLELLGLAAAAVPQRLAWAAEHLARTPAGCWRPGLSPHAPYTVHAELLAGAVRLAAQACPAAPLAMHLAESSEELSLLHDGRGPFRTLLQDLGAWQEGAIPAGTRPLDYLKLLAEHPRSLVIHGNYLEAAEQAWAAQQHDRMTVVYCPRTHARFGHPPHPLPQLLAAGAAVALGTDGRASNPDLNLLAEMRHAARTFPQLAPETILRLGTLYGARALGRQQQAGSLLPGKQANFCVLPHPESATSDVLAALFATEGPGETRVMLRGAWSTATVG